MANLLSKTEFFTHLPAVKQSLFAFFSSRVNPDALRSLIHYIDKLIDYNVPHGKLFRGLTLIHAYQLLNENIDESRLNSLCKIGWALEVIHAGILMADDIIDHSITRRGRPCWYKQEDVGMNAVNDAMFLSTAAEIMIMDELRHSTYFEDINNLLNEVKIMTFFGQQIDSQHFPIEKFTEENYIEICRCKTSYCTFIWPILAAVRMSLNTREYDAELRALCYAMGYNFQVQNDFLDCFGGPNITGKIGTDIENGQCTWLIVQAVKALHPNSSSFEKLKECYNSDKVMEVKNIYESLGLKEKYYEFEEEQKKYMSELIENLSIQKLQPLFRNLLHLLHGRSR